MKRIDVHFQGWGQNWQLGTLAEAGPHLLFEYSSNALQKGIQFSPIHLPLRQQAYGDFPDFQFRLPGMIADCLPDGWGLMLMDRLFRRMGKDPGRVSPLQRLAVIGDRAMGAYTFQPADAVELAPADIQLLELAAEVQKVVDDQDSAALRELLLVGGSPQGARPKALVQFDPTTGRVSTLPDAPGSPWLVKFPGRGEHKEVCAIEHLYASLARQCGLDMPRTNYFDLGKAGAAFGIERFDREGRNRVPVHGLAGALHVDFRIPNTSYQTLLRATRALTHSEREVQKAFERCVFNVVFNNRDDHAKNFSFRMNESFVWQLAPCYDLTYCEGPNGYHQMDVEGEALYPGLAQLLQLAVTNSLKETWARRTIERFVAVASQFPAMASDYPIRKGTRVDIARAITGNCARLL
jgi:serine/threonine-protein kinase HipA